MQIGALMTMTLHAHSLVAMYLTILGLELQPEQGLGRIPTSSTKANKDYLLE